MSLWSNIVNAVQNYFSPKPAVQNTVPSVQSSKAPSSSSQMQSIPGQYNVASKSYNAPLKTSAPMSSRSSAPSYSAPSSSGGGGSLPSSSSSAPSQGSPSILDGISTNVKNAEASVKQAIAPVVGKAGKALTTVGTALHAPQLAPGGLGAAGQNWAGFEQAVQEAKKGGFLQELPEVFKSYSEAAGGIKPEDVWNVFAEAARGAINPQWGKGTILNPNLFQYLQQNQPSNVKTGAVGKLTGAAKGQILPSAAKAGAPAQPSTGIVPSPATTPRNAIVPSAVNAATLPANMQGLTAQNVNVPVAKAISPEAIRSIGQLLLQSVVGNQSPLTSMTPALAQALWGAPTAASAFGGYEGGAAVPSQTSITQDKEIPLPVRPLNMG